MKRLENVLLLATAHNITKAYIHKLNNLEVYPSKVVVLDWRNSSYSNNIEGLNPSDFSKAISSINSTLKTSRLFTGDLTASTEETLNKVGWEYKKLTIDHINDKNLITFLKGLSKQFIIYCGGGILRNDILNSGNRFIHIHPGEVPHVKGADGLLWSALVHNRIGMSAFFMNDGIDTGDIIDTKNYSAPRFEFDFNQLDFGAVKKLLINYVDPHYRAELLGSLFERNPNPDYWQTTKQFPSEGKTYYFMHKALLPRVINNF